MEIRKYAKKYYSAFLQCFGDYFTNDLRIVLTKEQFEEVCGDIVGRAERGVIFLDLLFIGGVPSGFVIYQIDSPASDWCEKIGRGCIREIWVKTNLRGEGYGKDLLIYAENNLKEKNVQSIYLTADDESAFSFYKKAGYGDTGEICKTNECRIFEKATR